MNEKNEDDNAVDKLKMETLEQKIEEIEDALDEFAKQVPKIFVISIVNNHREMPC